MCKRHLTEGSNEGRAKNAEHPSGIHPAQQEYLLWLQWALGRLGKHLCTQVLELNSCLAGNKVCPAGLPCEGTAGCPALPEPRTQPGLGTAASKTGPKGPADLSGFHS